MYRITTHPILPVPAEEQVSFLFEGKTIIGQKGQTVAAALHQAGYPVHSLSLEHRKRTMECGIGKCGACEMLVDGKIRRICVTKVDGVREVARLSADSGFKGVLVTEKDGRVEEREVYKTTVAIIGAGPAGLAVREELLKEGVDCLVIDSNSEIGGQFLMQTHQFFFFEKEKRFGGMRGFDIARTLAGDSHEGIMLDSVVWDILEGKRLAVKNIATDKVFYVDTDELVIATGAVPFMPAFKNDDVPGVYTAAVVQRMMNTQFTLLGKNILTVGAGNIGYLTSYQALHRRRGPEDDEHPVYALGQEHPYGRSRQHRLPDLLSGHAGRGQCQNDHRGYAPRGRLPRAGQQGAPSRHPDSDLPRAGGGCAQRRPYRHYRSHHRRVRELQSHSRHRKAHRRNRLHQHLYRTYA